MYKKIFVFVLCMLVVTLSSCGKINPLASSKSHKASSSLSSQLVSISASTGSTAIQTFIFHVGINMPIFKCTATYSFPNQDIYVSSKITKIVITDSKSGAVIQTIVPPENTMFTKTSVFFSDVNFDGNTDLVIPLLDGANNRAFDAYVWNSTTNKFVECPSFGDILNPAVDEEDKMILSYGLSSAVSQGYSIFSFVNNQFVMTNQFYWDTAADDPSPPANADSLLHYIETKGPDVDHQTTVNSFFLPLNKNTFNDLNNPKLKPYFEIGSLWDLNSPKWTCVFEEN